MAKGGCSCGSMACTVCFMVTAVVMFILAMVAAAETAKYSPVWQPIICHDLPKPPSIRNIDADWINITGVSGDRCENPNPYPIQIFFYQNGELFFNYTDADGNESILFPSGYSTHNECILPPGGAADRISIVHSIQPYGRGVMVIQQGPVPVTHKLYVDRALVMSIYGMEFKAGAKVEAWCAYTYHMLNGVVGGTECFSSFEEVVVPPLEYQEPKPQVVDLKPEDKAKLESLKLVAMILPMILFLLLFVGCCGCGIYSFTQGRKGATDQAPANNL